MTGRRIRPIPIYAKQYQFAHATEWLRAFVGGRGTGKTWIGSYSIIVNADPGDPWMGVSPDAGVVHDTTLPTFIEVAKATGTYIKSLMSPYPRVWWRTRGGGVAQIVFRSGEKPDKLRGPSKAGLWLDEASVLQKEVFDIGIATLRHKGKMGPVLMTMTPRGRSHWTFEQVYDTVDEAMIGTTGFDMTGIDYVQGKAYRRRKNSLLVQACTLDNPFLPDEFYANISDRYTSALAEQELQGSFVDIQGLMFRREWFLAVDSAPRDARRVRYWDRAATPGAGSYSAGVLVAMDNRGLFYVEDVVRGQWSAFDRDVIIEQTAERDRHKYQGEVLIYVEQEGGSGGKEAAHQMVTRLAGHPVFRDIVGGTQRRTVDGQKIPGEAKVVRAMPLAAQAEAGNVRMVRGKWNGDYLDEITAFPEYTFSDQVDATSGAVNKLAGGVFPQDATAEKKRVAPESNRFGAGLALQRTRARRSRNER